MGFRGTWRTRKTSGGILPVWGHSGHRVKDGWFRFNRRVRTGGNPPPRSRAHPRRDSRQAAQGHEACGAVSAAIKSIKEGTTLPGHLPALVTSISPAIKAVLDKPGDTLKNAIKQNVILNVEKLKIAAPILSKAVEDEKVLVVGAMYHFASGRIELVT